MVVKPIPRDREGKTAGQRDREARQQIERQERRIVLGLLVLMLAVAAIVGLGIWHALAR